MKNIKLPTLLQLGAILVVLVFLCAGFYLYLKIEQVANENSALKEQIAQQATPDLGESEELVINEYTDATTSTSTITDVQPESENDSDNDQVVERTIIKTETIYVPEKVKEINEESVLASPVVSEEVSEPVVVKAVHVEPITVNSIRQTAYPDGYGGVYGSYEIEIAVNPSGKGDILIPQTSTHSIGTGLIGFSYSVAGEDFKGNYDSNFVCSVRADGYCKFKDDGKTRTMLLTVFLVPDFDVKGSFSVLFESVSYIQNGEQKSTTLNKKTANINLFY